MDDLRQRLLANTEKMKTRLQDMGDRETIPTPPTSAKPSYADEWERTRKTRPTPPAHAEDIEAGQTETDEDGVQRVLQHEVEETPGDGDTVEEVAGTLGNAGDVDEDEGVEDGVEDGGGDGLRSVSRGQTVARPDEADLMTAEEAAAFADRMEDDYEPDEETVLEAERRTKHRKDAAGRMISLTPAQERYCALRAEGKKQVEAYTEAYEGCEDTMSRKTITEMASRTEAKPHIRARIQALKAAQNSKIYYDKQSMTLTLMDIMLDIAKTGQKDSDRLGAVKLLGSMKHMKLWDTADKSEADAALDTLSDAELMAKVSSLLKPKG